MRKGGQSSVYMVEHIKEDNKKFVLKKVKDKFYHFYYPVRNFQRIVLSYLICFKFLCAKLDGK